MKGIHTTPAHWRRHFKAQRSSGISVAAYLREQGIRSSQWYYWRKRLRGEPNQPVSLVPIKVTQEAPRSSHCRVHLPNGIVLEFSDRYEPAVLAGQLLKLGQV